jgi:hypothetical protein
MDKVSGSGVDIEPVWYSAKPLAGRPLFKAMAGKKYLSNKKRATKENVVIYFGDETGMRSDHQAGRVVPPKAEHPL